ncbi:acetyltransferase [Streptomyces sp. Je 1-79]|uniref:acetyltransferase n=1 Tax=Streptomyces sp. Je 1-79 TaxID=2943847 RepID=UPI0021A9477B|nr:acetyltransferase [Streptomyces sp. Je 1-79]MCT4354488.1 acetyltransferase [Streptomyces sp. Je 1-79]
MRASVRRTTVVATAVAALAALNTTPAVAATPGDICGSGYVQIDSHTLRSASAVLARVHLLYNASNGTNCVVTVHAPATEGFALPTGAWLTVKGSATKKDQRTYSSYAGPVRAHAAGKCVTWGGMIEAGVGTYTYTSPWEHCG